MESSVTGAIKSIGERLWRRPASTDVAVMSELARYRKILDDVADVMLTHAIEPTPDSYGLIYRHVICGEPHLGEAYTRLIESGYPPASDANGASTTAEEELNDLAERAASQLESIEALVHRSHEDTKGFGDALQNDGLTHLGSKVSADGAISSLIQLTRDMIDKTRLAEEELRTRGRTMTDLRMSLSEARVRASTDALTGLSNRREFERRLGAAGARAEAIHIPLSLAICDIDHFKVINDTHGHAMGDRVLQFISRVLEENCEPAGQVARLGGEEFVIIFEGKTAEQVYEIIDFARRDVVDRNIINKETGDTLGHVTFSAGVSSFQGSGDVGRLLRTADRALYKAKAQGRNCVVIGG